MKNKQKNDLKQKMEKLQNSRDINNYSTTII